MVPELKICSGAGDNMNKKFFLCKPKDLSLIPRMYIKVEGEEWLHRVVL